MKKSKATVSAPYCVTEIAESVSPLSTPPCAYVEVEKVIRHKRVCVCAVGARRRARGARGGVCATAHRATQSTTVVLHTKVHGKPILRYSLEPRGHRRAR